MQYGIAVLLVIPVATNIYIYRCMQYWQADYRRTTGAGLTEKQVRFDDGSVLNYAEGPDNGNALLLIHAQTGAWQDYTRVLPELSKAGISSWLIAMVIVLLRMMKEILSRCEW